MCKEIALLIVIFLAFTPVVDAKGFGKLKIIKEVTWNYCPKGLTYDPYPGECGNYMDTDNDGYCDHSEPPPWKRLSMAKQSNKLERYNVIPLIVLGLVFVFSAEIIERFYNRSFARYLWNVLLLTLAITSASIGFLLMFLDSKTIRSYDLIF